MRPETIKQLIETGLPASQVFTSGEDGRHFSAVVVSTAFLNKSRIERQQTVYATLQNHIQDGTIHAISIKTFTPEEWQTHQSKER